MFTFLCATNQAKALTFNGAYDFHKILARKNRIGFDKWDKAKKTFFIENIRERIKTKLLNLRQMETRARVSENMNPSRFSISRSVDYDKSQGSKKVKRSYQILLIWRDFSL